MENQAQLKQDIIEGLKGILKRSYAHCKDGNPNENDFIEINNQAHECFLKLSRLVVEKAV